MTGINSSTYFGNAVPSKVPIPYQAAVNVSAGELAPADPQYLYSRRYLDWNRRTFAYHAAGSQDSTFNLSTFNIDKGLEVTEDIADERISLNLTAPYGCAPQTWCISCAPFGSPNNIYTLFGEAMATVVVNTSRSHIPRYILLNTGAVRFDLVEGPFVSYCFSPHLSNNFTDSS